MFFPGKYCQKDNSPSTKEQRSPETTFEQYPGRYKQFQTRAFLNISPGNDLPECFIDRFVRNEMT